MGTINYEALIEKRRGKGDEIEQRKRANKLAEIARNLESLRDLAEAADKKCAPDAAQVVPAPEQAKRRA
jgi:hypothetical protein